ncbi:hypothetical protein SGLAD_v1c02960 [Spiroplasma gladiatoris]|uniref:Transmembrane protein n=1 Tax=Spiroplasma gladiatoris TaxID=2143 RepID=A0A4P7AGI5_9MOLU|nr:hypothetical protein [Spiroplasma gladiatoris]QBQ07495.1 hypothetical protein SGLAD_v1c02960 [Spiroplasma gladiatoris]
MTIACLITIKIFDTFIYSNAKIININSADINISTSKINEIISKFLEHLKIDDLKVIYGDHNSYIRVTKMLNKNKKQIDIPKWIMPSVGYELDYLLGSIWYSSKIYQKDKYVKRFNLIAQVLPTFFIFAYLLFFVLNIILIILNKYVLSSADYYGSIFEFLGKYFILDMFVIILFIFYISSLYFATKQKINIETLYERDIVKFVDENCVGYKSDIGAARVHSIKIDKLFFNTFMFNKKTSNMKFLGPFTLL